jgi:4-coumarate--CoA ligase
MFHAAIAPRAHTSTLKLGEKSYVMRRFDLEAFAASIEKFGATQLVLVPPIAIALIMAPIVKKYSLKSIRWGGIGAAPLSKELQARLLALLANDAWLIKSGAVSGVFMRSATSAYVFYSD